MVQSPICLRCGHKEETVEHLFFECETSVMVWHCSTLGLRLDNEEKLHFSKWACWWFEHAPDKQMIIQSIIIFWQWLARNRFVWQNIEFDPVQIWFQSQRMMIASMVLFEVYCEIDGINYPSIITLHKLQLQL